MVFVGGARSPFTSPANPKVAPRASEKNPFEGEGEERSGGAKEAGDASIFEEPKKEAAPQIDGNQFDEKGPGSGFDKKLVQK